MSLVAHPPKANAWFVPLRFAMRELRGGLRGFYVLIFCIALGVMAIAGIGSLAESLAGGLAREGRTILGGDVSFSLIHREASVGINRPILSRKIPHVPVAGQHLVARSQIFLDGLCLGRRFNDN